MSVKKHGVENPEPENLLSRVLEAEERFRRLRQNAEAEAQVIIDRAKEEIARQARSRAEELRVREVKLRATIAADQQRDLARIERWKNEQIERYNSAFDEKRQTLVSLVLDRVVGHDTAG
ncbi:MAG: hypothetical protein OEZ54_04600 [Gemmatimonadota bacterium]|nr:hypothetical protein [Gemmatimonadota bacterium]